MWDQLWASPQIQQVWQQLNHFIGRILSLQTAFELGLMLTLALVAWWGAAAHKPWLKKQSGSHSASSVSARLTDTLGLIIFPLYWLLLQWLVNYFMLKAGEQGGLMVITASLLSAWVLIRIASTFIHSEMLSGAFATIAWLIAALNIVGWLTPAVEMLNYVGVDFSGVRISLLTVMKGVLVFAALLWLSNILATLFENRIRKIPELTPSVQELFAKLFKITVIFFAIVASVSAVGIDLTAFAVIGGAVGVGIGLGLQKIAANLISGIILLMDKSIKPGDVIAIGEYYGRVDSLGARYVSVATRDGVEHLIPNEELVVNRVENWSHSNNLYRLRLGLGIHYDSDVRLAMQLCLESCRESPRVLADPPAICLLKNFGDSSVDLELRYWINDPMNGRANIKSDILLRIWDRFHAHNIKIPYPQRDLHFYQASDADAGQSQEEDRS